MEFLLNTVLVALSETLYKEVTITLGSNDLLLSIHACLSAILINFSFTSLTHHSQGFVLTLELCF